MISAHSRVLKNKLEARIGQIQGWMADGVPEDFDSYRSLVGLIQGLREALLLSDEADKELSGD